MADHKKNPVSVDDQKASSIAPEAALNPKGDVKKKVQHSPRHGVRVCV